MPMKAMFEKENAALKRRIARLEKELAMCKQAEKDNLKEEVTERKRVEQALAEANAKLEKLFEVLPVGLSVLDKQGQVVKENPMLEKILDLSADELVRGKYNQRRYIHSDGSPFNAQEYPSARILAGETMVQDVEIGIVKENNQTIWTRVSAAVVPFSDWKVVIATRDFTKRKRAELALSESEERFSRVFHHNPAVQLISRVDDGRIMEVNEACCRLVGRSRQELIGHNAAELDFWSDPAMKQQQVQQFRRAGNQGPFEINIRHSSGMERTIVLSSEPIEINGMKALISTAIDITDSKKMYMALRESEQRFTTIFNNSPIAIVVSHLSNGQMVEVNPAMEKLLGYSREEMIGHDAAELQTWGDLQERQMFVERLQAQGNVKNFETIARMKSGGRVNVQLTAQILEINQEKLLLAEIVDITERKRVEQLLTEREHFISSVINTSPAIIYVYDMEEQRNVFANTGLTGVLGYSPEQVLDMGADFFATLIHPDDLARVTAFQEKIMEAADGQVIESENRAKHLDGSWRFLRNYESPFLRHADGTVKQKIGVAIDTTERKQAEENLKLVHEQLQMLSRLLIEVQEDERRAIGRELHDEIGQALTGLKILLEMAGQAPAGTAHAKLEQAVQITSELLDRIRWISLDLRPTILDDMGLLPALLWLIQNFKKQTSIEIDFVHQGTQQRRFEPAIETAVYRITQESLTNIARYAQVRQARVHITCDETQIELIVEDAGTGFDAQDKLKSGKTVGLMGMRERVRLLGGEFSLQSTPGLGTKVMIRIPLDES